MPPRTSSHAATAFSLPRSELKTPAFLFIPTMVSDSDEQDDIVVACRVREGAALSINSGPSHDDAADDIPLQLVREEGTWRVVNCDQYVPY